MKLLKRTAVISTFLLSTQALAQSYEGLFFSTIGNVQVQAAVIHGNINLNSYTIDINNFTQILPEGLLGEISNVSIELLPPGTYSTTPPWALHPVAFEVAEGQVGGLISFTSSFGMIFPNGPNELAYVWEIINTDQTILEPLDLDGDGYPQIIDYSLIPADSPLGPMSLRITTENTIAPYATLDLNIEQSEIECTNDGAAVSASIDLALFNGAVLEGIEWRVDGELAGNDMAFNEILPLGSHTLEVTALLSNGLPQTRSGEVDIVDTLSPEIIAYFYDNKTGEPISSVTHEKASFVGTRFDVSDQCDSAPSVSAFGGFPINDGDTLRILGDKDTIRLNTPYIEMRVNAVDASGNISEHNESLLISE